MKKSVRLISFYAGLVIAVMILIMAIGYVVDRAIFEQVERRMRVKWGLVAAA